MFLMASEQLTSDRFLSQMNLLFSIQVLQIEISQKNETITAQTKEEN